MLNLLGVIANGDYIVEDGFMFVTRQISMNGHSGLIDLRGFKILILDGKNMVNPDTLRDHKYYRATFYVLDQKFKLEFDDGDIKRTCMVNLRKNNFGTSTVNEEAFIDARTVLSIEYGVDESNDLLVSYKKLMAELLRDENFQHEMLRSNLDDVTYGFKDNCMYVINKDDEYIRRMMKYEGNDLTFYYFGEDLQTMSSHILTRFVRYHGNKLVADVDFSMKGIAECDNKSVLLLPIQECTISINEVREVVKLFERSYAYLD